MAGGLYRLSSSLKYKHRPKDKISEPKTATAEETETTQPSPAEQAEQDTVLSAYDSGIEAPNEWQSYMGGTVALTSSNSNTQTVNYDVNINAKGDTQIS